MRTSFNFKTFLTIALALIAISCNNSSDKEKHREKTDTAVSSTTSTPSKTTSATSDTAARVEKCYKNDGLKFSTTITLIKTSDTELIGGMMVRDLATGEKQGFARFTGSIRGDELTIVSKGKFPAVGDASEWTDKPWTLHTKDGKERISIIFNAKDYDTNKWKETVFEFDLSPCK